VSDSNVIKLAQQGPLSIAYRNPAERGAWLLTQAVEAEVAEFLAKHSISGPRPAISASFATVIFGTQDHDRIGPIAIRQPRVRDREAAEGERIRYSPSICRRTRGDQRALRC